MAYFKVISHNLPGDNEGNHEKPPQKELYTEHLTYKTEVLTSQTMTFTGNVQDNDITDFLI
jgi:hypothetical protein